MENILISFAIIIGIIVVSSIINEKKLHIPHDIAILLTSFILGILIVIAQRVGVIEFEENMINFLREARLDNFLLESTLCFMMFASASKIHLNKFIKNIKSIASLSIITTIVSSIVYASTLYAISLILSFNLNIGMCLLIGSAISLTDSLSTTGRLNKLGLSKSISSIMEGESLFNDGASLAIFVFAKEMLIRGTTENILLIMIKDILGAFVVGFVISFILFKLIKLTNEPINHILISLLTVSVSYSICEYFGFSGVIASVVCGMYFAYQTKKISRWKEVVDSKELYKDFWIIAENILNSILFVLVGLYILSLEINQYTFILIPISIILNLLSRYAGVYAASKIISEKNIPSKYNLSDFVKLLTWGGIKGGVSLALVMTTQNILSSYEYQIVINVTLITILFTTIVQGMTVSNLYKSIETKREARMSMKSLTKI